MKKYLIIGNGVAGTTAAEFVRKGDPEGSITVVTDEDLAFYNRMKLNEFISGELSEPDLILKKESWYGEQGIELKTGVRITEARPKETVMTVTTPATTIAARPATARSNEPPPTLPTPLAEALSKMGEDPDLPESVMLYPEDWKERTDRTKPERTGILFEGEPFQDARGNAVQTVVYDVRSLILPTPNFQYVPLRDLQGTTQSAADRNALHNGSEIFNGYADDLAAGTALLGDFGGVGNWPASFSDDGRELAELIRVIEEMTTP